jgi:hypothetical protein
MSRLALVNILNSSKGSSKNLSKNWNNKIITNKNIVVTASDCVFTGTFENPQNIYLYNTDPNFVNENIQKLSTSNNLYLDSYVQNCETLKYIQYKLNKNLNWNIYMNKKYYQSFMNSLETVSKFYTGSAYDNCKQIIPLDMYDYKCFISNAKYEDIKFR